MNSKTTIALGIALALGACASMPPPNPQLENARVAVQTAQADPNVARYAQLDVDAAKKDLDVAESAYAAKQYEQVNQPAYLATQNARLAQAHAAAKVDDAKVAAGQADRDKIMLMARTREAENAKLQADQAKLSADAARQQADASRQEAAAAQAELDALKAQQTNRGTVITLGDVLFDTGMSNLKSGAGRKLDQLSMYLMEHPDRRVQVDGFTDSVGTDSYNEELSQRRADAVKSALVQKGIEPSRISTEGYGKAFPVANNTDSGGRQLNRRVEVVIGGSNNAAIAPRTAGL